MTLIDLIERSSARLDEAGVSFGHGTTNAFDEAVWLALWCMGLPLDELDGVAERQLSPLELHAIEALIGERIATRRPAAYLTGEAWLQGVPFHVDERVIVPRSLIAEPKARSTSGSGARRGAYSTCAPAAAAWPCSQRWPGPMRGSMRPTCRPTRWRWRR
jgi:ribosomal protein L3 glutamine methyltransferase